MNKGRFRLTWWLEGTAHPDCRGRDSGGQEQEVKMVPSTISTHVGPSAITATMRISIVST
jgi:hypothetical protein